RALPSRQLAPATARTRGHTGVFARAPGLPGAARAPGSGARSTAPGGVPAVRGEASYAGTSGGGVGRSTLALGGEGQAPLASRGATGALSSVDAVAGGPLEPDRTGAGRHVAAVGETLAPAVAAAQGAGSSASAGTSQAGRQALEGAEV